MAIRIEIARMYNNKLELRVGDLTGSTTLSNSSKEDVLSEIGGEIDELPVNKEIPKENNCLNCKHSFRDEEKTLRCKVGGTTFVGKGRNCFVKGDDSKPSQDAPDMCAKCGYPEWEHGEKYEWCCKRFKQKKNNSPQQSVRARGFNAETEKVTTSEDTSKSKSEANHSSQEVQHQSDKSVSPLEPCDVDSVRQPVDTSKSKESQIADELNKDYERRPTTSRRIMR